MHCKGAGISPVSAGSSPGVDDGVDGRLPSQIDRNAVWLAHDLFPKTGAHPGSSPGQAFRDHALEHVPVPTESGNRVAHVLIGKPVPAFPGHAPGQRRAIRWDQSGRAPENLTTLAHFSVSSTMNTPSSAGEPRNIVVPKSASRACILVSIRTASTSLLRRPMISAGVFLRKPMANHWLAT